MKAQIRDIDALRAISPAALGAFARAEGWHRIEAFGTHADIYAAPDRPEIILPRTDRLADYPSAVSSLLTIFAKVVGQDELATYRDLVGADRDVVRVRAIGAEDDGSVMIDAGVKIVSQARDMLLAAACAVRTPQAIYRAGANREATDYMGRVRLGQTEHGSFVVTLLAPVPPLLSQSTQMTLEPTWAPLDDEPLERMVTRRLVIALEASRNAAELALSGEGNAFERAIASGVSANLCEAVAGLIEQSNGLDVSVTWAKTRPAPEAQRKVSFSNNDAEVLREAARTFRLRQPQPDVTLFGTVHKLRRDQTEVDGVVTLKAVVENKLQSVRAILDQTNYSVAVQAHDAKKQVMMTGDLERSGQRWQLTRATVHELPDEDEADPEPAEAPEPT